MKHWNVGRLQVIFNWPLAVWIDRSDEDEAHLAIAWRWTFGWWGYRTRFSPHPMFRALDLGAVCFRLWRQPIKDVELGKYDPKI